MLSNKAKAKAKAAASREHLLPPECAPQVSAARFSLVKDNSRAEVASDHP
jgi:hypothetical protein